MSDQTGEDSSYWTETFVRMESLLEVHQKLASSSLLEEDAEEFQELVSEISSLSSGSRGPSRLLASLDILARLTQLQAGNTIRSLRRTRTTAPKIPLKISYDPHFALPKANPWISVLENSEQILIKAYQKLVTYSPHLRSKIEPFLETSAKTRNALNSLDSNSVLQVVKKQNKLLEEVLDSAYSLSEITAKLQEVESSQIALQKDSQETFNSIKRAHTEEPRRSQRKKTFLNVIYAPSEQDNLPIQTILKLVNDIQANQEMLKDLEAKKQECLKLSPRVRDLTQTLDEALGAHEYWESVAKIEEEDPLLSLYSKVQLMAEMLAGYSAEQSEEPIFLDKIERIIDLLPSFHIFLSDHNREDFEDLMKTMDKLPKITDATVRASQSLDIILQCFSIFSATIRSTRRSRTSGPARPLFIKLTDTSIPPPVNQMWMPSLENLNTLLVNAYHKLITYNPALRDKIEPSLASNTKIRQDIRVVDTETVCRVIEEQLLMVKEVLEQAYSLGEVTKQLQEVESVQVGMQKESQEVYNTLKAVLNNEVPRRANRKATYLNVIYAKPEEDNLPIQTTLKLVEDIKRNQDNLLELENFKKLCLMRQEKAGALVENIDEVLGKMSDWTEVTEVVGNVPLQVLYQKVDLLVQKISDNVHFEAENEILNEKLQRILQNHRMFARFAGKDVEELEQQEDKDFEGIEPTIDLILSYTNSLIASIRSSKRSKTTAPAQPLMLKFSTSNIVDEPTQSEQWLAPLQRLEDLLVKSYHKLISYNPELREKIEPMLVANSRTRESLKRRELEEIRNLIHSQLGLLSEILEKAYSLSEITQELQMIKSAQVSLQKESEEVYFKAKTLTTNQVDRRAARRRTYLNVIYAEPQGNVEPIVTILHLVDDIKNNNNLLQEIEKKKKECLVSQEKPKDCLELIQEKLGIDFEGKEPLLELYEVVPQIIQDDAKEYKVYYEYMQGELEARERVMKRLEMQNKEQSERLKGKLKEQSFEFSRIKERNADLEKENEIIRKELGILKENEDTEKSKILESLVVENERLTELLRDRKMITNDRILGHLALRLLNIARLDLKHAVDLWKRPSSLQTNQRFYGGEVSIHKIHKFFNDFLEFKFKSDVESFENNTKPETMISYFYNYFQKNYTVKEIGAAQLAKIMQSLNNNHSKDPYLSLISRMLSMFNMEPIPYYLSVFLVREKHRLKAFAEKKEYLTLKNALSYLESLIDSDNDLLAYTIQELKPNEFSQVDYVMQRLVLSGIPASQMYREIQNKSIQSLIVMSHHDLMCLHFESETEFYQKISEFPKDMNVQVHSILSVLVKTFYMNRDKDLAYLGELLGKGKSIEEFSGILKNLDYSLSESQVDYLYRIGDPPVNLLRFGIGNMGIGPFGVSEFKRVKEANEVGLVDLSLGREDGPPQVITTTIKRTVKKVVS